MYWIIAGISWILIGVGLSLYTSTIFGDREHAIETALDVVLWPAMVYQWAKFWVKSNG